MTDHYNWPLTQQWPLQVTTTAVYTTDHNNDYCAHHHSNHCSWSLQLIACVYYGWPPQWSRKPTSRVATTTAQHNCLPHLTIKMTTTADAHSWPLQWILYITGHQSDPNNDLQNDCCIWPQHWQWQLTTMMTSTADDCNSDHHRWPVWYHYICPPLTLTTDHHIEHLWLAITLVITTDLHSVCYSWPL